jgi:hypothetical protein
MNKAEEIIIDTLTRASVRIHWVFLANLILSALVLSSVYNRTYSYDGALVRAAPIFILDTEEKIQAIEQRNHGSISLEKPNGTRVELANVGSWSEADRKDYGDLISRQHRAVNSLKQLALESAQTPLISAKIYTNDFEVFCGVLMTMLSMWIFFSTNKIVYLVNHPKTKGIIKDYVWAVRDIFETLHSNVRIFRALVTTAIIFLPFVSMLISTIVTMSATSRIQTLSYRVLVEDAFFRLIFIKQMLCVFLLLFAVAILAMGLTALYRLRDNG